MVIPANKNNKPEAGRNTGFSRSSKRYRKLISKSLAYLLLIFVGIIMIYPLLFMFFGTFKENYEIFGSLKILPNRFTLEPYIKGWRGSGQYTYTRFYLNTFLLVIPTVLFTLISSTLVAYGFARFKFKFHGLLFSLMLSTLMLPNTVVIIPRFILFRSLGWLNSYLPFIVPALFAANPFFVFMLVQFFRGIPKELDDAASIDGCNSFKILTDICLPLLKPALFSAGIFQFIWTWNNFFNALIYINDVKKYPISLALKMSVDVTTGVDWNQVLAMSFLAILPSVIIFFVAQKYFVEGIATTGLKG